MIGLILNIINTRTAGDVKMTSPADIFQIQETLEMLCGSVAAALSDPLY